MTRPAIILGILFMRITQFSGCIGITYLGNSTHQKGMLKRIANIGITCTVCIREDTMDFSKDKTINIHVAQATRADGVSHSPIDFCFSPSSEETRIVGLARWIPLWTPHSDLDFVII